jgi:hypothetical protein
LLSCFKYSIGYGKVKGKKGGCAVKKLIMLILVITIILTSVFMYAGRGESDDMISGPPTVQEHLMQINANTAVVKWLVSAIGTMFFMLSGAVVYIFKSTVANLKSGMQEHEEHLKEIFDIKLGAVENKADIALEKTDIIEKDFVSITTHDRQCPHVK